MNQKKTYVFLADGVEEVESMGTVDVLRRAGMTVVEVAVADSLEIIGAHGQKIIADTCIADVDLSDAEWLILPGGMPGASNLFANETLCHALSAHNNSGGKIAAICAAPAVVLAPLGILSGKQAVCYPGFEAALSGGNANVIDAPVAVSENTITAKGPGITFDFALEIVCQTLGKDVADNVAKGMLLTV